MFERRPIMRAADELAYQADVETRNRKPLRRPLEDLPAATWELRIRSRHRLLYGIYRVIEDEKEQGIVEILRAIIKENETTEKALRRNR